MPSSSLSAANEATLRRAFSNEQGWFDLNTLLVRGETETDLDTTVDKLFGFVDDSHYSLEDWGTALIAFDQWLEKDGNEKSRPLDSMIGYLHCCQMTSAETLAPPELSGVVVEMLDQHGFEGETGEGDSA